MVERRRGPPADYGECEPTDDKSVRQPIVDDDRVALRISVAGCRSDAVPQVVLREGSEQRAALAIDRDCVIDRFDIVARADVAIRVRRPAGAALTPGAQIIETEAGKVLAGAGHRSTRTDDLLRSEERRRGLRCKFRGRWSLQSRPIDLRCANRGRRTRESTQVAAEFARMDFGLLIGHALDRRGLRRSLLRAADDGSAHRQDKPEPCAQSRFDRLRNQARTPAHGCLHHDRLREATRTPPRAILQRCSQGCTTKYYYRRDRGPGPPMSSKAPSVTVPGLSA